TGPVTDMALLSDPFTAEAAEGRGRGMGCLAPVTCYLALVTWTFFGVWPFGVWYFPKRGQSQTLPYFRTRTGTRVVSCSLLPVTCYLLLVTCYLKPPAPPSPTSPNCAVYRRHSRGRRRRSS